MVVSRHKPWVVARARIRGVYNFGRLLLWLESSGTGSWLLSWGLPCGILHNASYKAAEECGDIGCPSLSLKWALENSVFGCFTWQLVGQMEAMSHRLVSEQGSNCMYPIESHERQRVLGEICKTTSIGPKARVTATCRVVYCIPEAKPPLLSPSPPNSVVLVLRLQHVKQPHTPSLCKTYHHTHKDVSKKESDTIRDR